MNLTHGPTLGRNAIVSLRCASVIIISNSTVILTIVLH